MSKVMIRAKCEDQAYLDSKFAKANSQWEAGKLKSAFRLFLIAAKSGDQGAQLNLGNFYSDGIGVKPNRTKAFYWYRRAYQRGSGEAASNIGILLRDENRFDRALEWFGRAVKLRDGDANVEIAKIHILRNNRAQAMKYLKLALRAKRSNITEGSREESQRLLTQLGA